MSDVEYRSNSHKSREGKEEIKPVARGNVTVKEESLGKKFSNTFLSENLGTVSSYVIFDVVVPAITDMIVDGLCSGISMLFKGTSAPRRSYSSSGHGSNKRTNYSSFSRGDSGREIRRPERNRYGMLDIIFDNRGDAIEVRDCLDELMDKYSIVSVADYYELANASKEANYTDSKYGWYTMDGVQITRDRDGYRLVMPKPEPLD